MPTNTVKTASIAEITLILEWARKESWNPGLNDALPFHVTDPAGFLISKIDDQQIASISVVRYANNFAFLGCYIVQPEYRGKGYGLQIWEKGMDFLKDFNVGLDGVVTQQENYKKSGFKLAHRNVRYSGKIMDTKTQKCIHAKIIPFDLLLDYDKNFFPASRPAFLAAWLNMPASVSLAMMENNRILGLGVIRKCFSGHKIGPLFADNIKIAEQLLLNLCEHAPDQDEIFLDVPEINANAIHLAESYGLRPIFETARMYTKQAPALDWSKIFGVTTFELG